MQKLRDQILQYFRDHYLEEHKTPSVRNICEKFELSNKKFYTYFPGGVAELCKEINIPKPETSYKRIEKALEAKREVGKKIEKELDTDEKYNVLKQTESILEAKAREIGRKTELHKRIGKLVSDLSTTDEGRKEIFNDAKLFRVFCEVMLPETLKRLKIFCDERRILFESTLVVLGKDCDANYGFWGYNPLDQYVKDVIEAYMNDYKKEERQEALQKEFSDILLNWTCPHCSSDATRLITIDGKLHCFCGDHLELLCLNCKAKLKFEGGAWHCPSCKMVFNRPVVHEDYAPQVFRTQ